MLWTPDDETVSVSSVKSVIGEKWKNKINDLCKRTLGQVLAIRQ